MLSGRELRLGYHGVGVVEDASVTLAAGQVSVLVGPNGSGKSTLLRALARLHKPSAGTVQLDDDDALALSPSAFARRVTMLGQSRPTPGGVSVRDVVAYGRHPHRRRWRQPDLDGPGALARAIELTGLGPLEQRFVDELSGGERQRVWLAMCLAQDTSVLLLDEPTTFLDLRYQVEMLDLITELAHDRGVAVGAVLHDLNQAADVADHLVILHKGQIRAAGSPAAVLTASLLEEVYGIAIEVEVDPVSGRPATRPIGRLNRQ
jgi:iron complex transport system ATP-binding protein